MRDQAMEPATDPREPARGGASQGSAAPQARGGDDPSLRATVQQGSPTDDAASPFQPGALIADRYRLVKPIGRGGMAEVWRATHEELRIDVAIKFIAGELAHDPVLAPAALARFRFEAQVSARLAGKTRHVVAVHDAGSHRGVPFLVMELINGYDLENEVNTRGPLDPWRVAHILDQVADALDSAHAMGIVHRDIKPSNILLIKGEDGTDFVKVADFGIAKATRDQRSLDVPRATVNGLLVGSPGFMSPEQVDGTKEILGTSDIWSLGTVVYEALTAKPCFEGDTVSSLLIAVSTRKFAPMSSVVPSLGRAIDEWLNQCLAHEPSERFQTIAEMSAAFRKALPANRDAPAAAPRSRIRPVLLVATVLAALIAIAVGGYFWRASSDVAEVPPASSTTASPLQTSGLPPEPTIEPVTARGPSSAQTSTEAAPTPVATNQGSPAKPTAEPSAEPSAAVAAPPVSVIRTAPAPAPSPTLPTKNIDPSEIH